MGFIAGAAQGFGTALVCTYLSYEIQTAALSLLGGEEACVPRTLVAVALLSAALGSCASEAATLYLDEDGTPRRGAAGTLIGGLIVVQAMAALAALTCELSMLSVAVLAAAFACGHIAAAAGTHSVGKCVVLAVPLCVAATVAMVPSAYIDEAIDSGFDAIDLDLPPSEYPRFQILNTGHSLFAFPAAAAAAHGAVGTALLFSVSRSGPGGG